MHGISFSVAGDLSLTPEGTLRVHPTSINTVGITVGGLMKFFGLTLQKLVNTEHARGVRVEQDDFLLSRTELLPGLAVEGLTGQVEVNDSEIVQTFVPTHGPGPAALKAPHEAANYKFFREGTLRFGKLTMLDTGLLIVDAEPEDPFDFFLDRYNDQLVAGYSRTTADKGLIVTIADVRKLAGRSAAAGTGGRDRCPRGTDSGSGGSWFTYGGLRLEPGRGKCKSAGELTKASQAADFRSG